MSLLTLLLLGILAYLIYTIYKQQKIQRTNAFLVAQYLRTILLLIDEMKGDEKDLYKQLLRGYVYEYENTPIFEFNEPWEALAKACKIQPIYSESGGTKLVDKRTVEMATSVIYTNRHWMDDLKKSIPRELSIKELEKRVSAEKYVTFKK